MNFGATFDWPVSLSNDYYVLIADSRSARSVWSAKVNSNKIEFQWRTPSPDPGGADPIAGTTLLARREVTTNPGGADNDNTRGLYFDPTVPGGAELWLKWNGTQARQGYVVRRDP